jgi:hypothetical protein
LDQINLSDYHNDDWALFLPAISSFFISGLGKQREGENYFDPTRIPAGFNGDVECLNFFNSKAGLFTYKWGLYSAGHANLDITKDDNNESIIRKREEGTFLLGDSGGFQILKCQWPADWKDPNCPRAMKKRTEVLKWMDEYMDYGMCLDIPSQSLTTYHIKDKKTSTSAHGISTIEEAITATHINNEYFINNRDGRCKFLNVLQGRNHKQSDDWYEEMKKYCDTNIYGDRAFNGWAFGGQNKIDIHLMLKRLVGIIHDGFLEEGKHDLIHCLGTSIMEYAVLFTDIQKAIRKYHNSKFKITFDCASPFFAAAKGLAYNNNTFEHDTKWTYAMEKTAENKKYATDNRKYSQGCLEDNIHQLFTDSPITDRLLMKDICYRGVGFLGQHGKETKTSWDTLSYTLIQAHNVYQHIYAVQEANRRYETGILPNMVIDKFDHTTFGEIVDEIFSLKDRQSSLDLIEHYSKFWTQMKAGQGFSGKKAVNSETQSTELFDGKFGSSKVEKVKKEPLKSMFDDLFSVDESDIEVDEEIIDSDDAIQDMVDEL